MIAAIIFLGSILPLPERRTSGPIGPDTAIHVVIHAWLTLAVARAYDEPERSTARIAVVAAIGSIVYGIGIEHVQHRIPSRRFEWGDIAGTTLGSVVGAYLFQADEGQPGGDGTARIPVRYRRSAPPDEHRSLYG